MGLPLYRGPFGETVGGLFAGTSERKESISGFLFLDPEVIKILSLSEALASLRHTYLGSFFLDPDIRKLSIGAIWKEQGSFNLVQNMGHKGPVLRPRCIGPGRARTQILFYSSVNSLHDMLQRQLKNHLNA
jgi:hypothetical protein